VQVLQLHERGVVTTAIADALNVSDRRVRELLRDAGCGRNRPLDPFVRAKKSADTRGGCLEWQRDGLGLPPAVEQATREYRVDEDVLGTFIAERCILEGEIQPAELRAAYDAFCDEIGERALSASVFGKRLARRGIRREGQNGAYRGIRLR
jgi:hypothetical protein